VNKGRYMGEWSEYFEDFPEANPYPPDPNRNETPIQQLIRAKLGLPSQERPIEEPFDPD
jgi:hypothetical protein